MSVRSRQCFRWKRSPAPCRRPPANCWKANVRLMPEAVDDLLHSVACKAAIKAHDRTSMPEMADLVRVIRQDRDVRFCPHWTAGVHYDDEVGDRTSIWKVGMMQNQTAPYTAQKIPLLVIAGPTASGQNRPFTGAGRAVRRRDCIGRFDADLQTDDHRHSQAHSGRDAGDPASSY